MWVDVYMYYEMNSRSCGVDRIDFFSPMLNRSYDVLNILGDTTFDREARTLSLTTRAIEPTCCQFDFCDVRIKVSSFYNVISRDREAYQPLSVMSVMTFEFEETMDYSLVSGLISIANSYLRFITQAKDVRFEKIDLKRFSAFGPTEGGGLAGKGYVSTAGGVVINGGNAADCTAIKHGFYLPIGGDRGLEGGIFQALAENQLITRHLVPLNKKSTWDFPRSIMLAASFDSTFSLLYPGGVRHSEKAVRAAHHIDEVLASVESDRDVNSTTRKKSKWLRRILASGDAFSSKLMQVWEDHDGLICSNGFSEYADEERMKGFSDRMEKMRNSLAHGTINVTVDERMVYDVQFLERIVLCCQLLTLGLDDDVAKDVISEALKVR